MVSQVLHRYLDSSFFQAQEKISPLCALEVHLYKGLLMGDDFSVKFSVAMSLTSSKSYEQRLSPSIFSLRQAP